MPTFEVTIVLDRLRSAFNTGNIFRLGDAVGAKEIVACGYTPAPPHPKLAKTAMGADEMVPCRCFTSSVEAIQRLRSEGVRQIIAVETDNEAAAAWRFDYQFPLALVFGNEALGVDRKAIELCDAVVGLPMFGRKTSINVGNCAAAVLYAVIARGTIEARPREESPQAGQVDHRPSFTNK